MATLHEVGPHLYWHTMNVPARGPVITHDFTHEIDDPFRVGRAAILRVPFTGWCLVIGYWFGNMEEDDALAAGAGIHDLEASLVEMRKWHRVR